MVSYLEGDLILKKLFLMLALFTTTQVFATELAKNICGPDAEKYLQLNDWEKDSKGKYCAAAQCRFPTGQLLREKCFAMQAPNSVSISTTDHSSTEVSSSSRGSGFRVILNAENPCTQSCLPEKRTFKTVSGFDRKECVECFKSYAFKAEDGDLNYPEIGRVIKKGSACYYPCKDTEGPIVLERVITPACTSCLEESGSFEYLIIKSGKCYEVDKRNSIYPVSADLCKKAGSNLIRTDYINIKSMSNWLGKTPPDCFEVDMKTLGKLYKMTTNKKHCDSSWIDDSDRNIQAEKGQPGKQSSGQKKSKASNQ